MHKIYRILLIILAFATGGLFLFSAYTKLVPTIQAFEYNIASQTHLHYMTAALMARFFIALEAGLGSLIAIHYFGRNKWVLKAAFLLVAAFSVYLIWLWIKNGNNINCGCFGDSIWMRPSTSLLKNALILSAIGLLMRYHKGFTLPFSNLIPIVHLACTFALTYLVYPIFTHYKINFADVYANKQFAPSVDLAKGKYIIAFVSRSCSHCRHAATIMHNMKQSDPAIPFYLIVGGTGTDDDLTGFWKETNAQDIPHTQLADGPFDKYTGGEYPQIIWVNNGWVEANTTYPELDQQVIERWMK
jgi:uncharacterized membrane protein YphA (DoxX/SURF4 family)